MWADGFLGGLGGGDAWRRDTVVGGWRFVSFQIKKESKKSTEIPKVQKKSAHEKLKIHDTT